jgi:hypothetical protein
MSSTPAIGFSGGGGLTFALAEVVAVSPGVRFLSLPADFDFTALPNRSLSVRALTLDFGLAVRF